MVDKKEKNEDYEEGDWIDIEVSYGAKEADEELRMSMESLCLVYEVFFQGLLDAVEQLSEDVYEMLGGVEHMDVQDVGVVHLVFTNVFRNVPLVFDREVVVGYRFL